MTRLTRSVAEAALILGASRRAVYDMIARGELRSIRIGRRVVVPVVALEELLGRSLDEVAS